MRRFLHAVIFLICLGITYFGFQTEPLKGLLQEVGKQRIYIDRSEDATFFADWTAEDVLKEINNARTNEGLTELELNEKLSVSATARLSVILHEDDYEGTKTGITREVAVKNAGYDANLIGDLVLLDFFKRNDLITFWGKDKNSIGTLNHPDFRDIGLAIRNNQDRVSLYAILVSPRKAVPLPAQPKKITWGGLELWEVINKRRVENGVNPLNKRDELCTIASIRLNQLLEINKLDGHAGFVPVLERPDLKWISEKYNISEYLVQGHATPTDAVKAWENTMGHKSLIMGGEFVWGCVYAQNTFGVAIAAY